MKRQQLWQFGVVVAFIFHVGSALGQPPPLTCPPQVTVNKVYGAQVEVGNAVQDSVITGTPTASIGLDNLALNTPQGIDTTPGTSAVFEVRCDSMTNGSVTFTNPKRTSCLTSVICVDEASTKATCPPPVRLTKGTDLTWIVNFDPGMNKVAGKTLLATPTGTGKDCIRLEPLLANGTPDPARLKTRGGDATEVLIDGGALRVKVSCEGKIAGQATINFTQEDDGFCANQYNCSQTVECEVKAIPTLSEWGIILLALLLLAAGTRLIVRF